MAQSNPFVIGRGSQVTVALLQPGSRAEVPVQSLTLGSAAAAAATSLGVTGLSAAFASAAIPLFLTFTDAIDQTDKFVKATALTAASAGSGSGSGPQPSTLTTTALSKAIAANSTAVYPVRLEARTAADLSTNANDTQTTTFDTGGYEDGIITKIGYGVSCPGNFLALDAGFRTCFHAFNNFLEVWLSIILPPPGGYTTGYIFKGPASVKNIPLKIPADGIITCDIEFVFRGAIAIVEPT